MPLTLGRATLVLVLFAREMVEGRQRRRKEEEMGVGVAALHPEICIPETMSIFPSLSSTKMPLEGKLEFFLIFNLLPSFDYPAAILVTSPSKALT